MKRRPAMAAVLAALLTLRPASGGDWPQWRGPGGGGVSSEIDLPVRWSETESIRWRAELPGRGLSSPVVAGGRTYLTASSGVSQGQLHVLCFEASNGKLLWERRFWATGSTQCHPKTSMAAPTPALDGERVYALFATCDLVALEASGVLGWYRSLARDYPELSNQVGMAASPVLWKGLLILALETDSGAFALAIDAQTGLNRWRVPRPRSINWVTPLLLDRGGAVEVLLQSRGALTSYDPETGRSRWSHAGELDPIASPVAAGGLVFIPAGEVLAVRPGSQEEPPKVEWKSAKLRASTASPLCYEGRVYALNSAGVLCCAAASDGALLWQERLKGPFSASPVAGDGKLYCVNEEGQTAVIDVRSEPRVLATNPLAETILASPAVSGGAIFLRSDRRLYCIGGRAVTGD